LFLTGEISGWQAILIGLVEGLTEFLPISSTAHMAIVPQLLRMPDPGAAFSAVVQLGPVVAIIAYFRHDLARYIRGILRTRTPANLRPGDIDARLGWFTVFATIPALILGKLLEKHIDREFRSLYVIAGALILLALFLWLAEWVGKRNKSLEQMTFPDSQAIGWAQTLALVPGASRSGVTMTAGMFLGLDRESATRFSFLLSVPVITAAGIYKLITDVLRQPDLKAEIVPYTLGTLVAAVSAYAIIHWFLGYMRRHNTGIFIVYRILLGLLLLALLHFGVIQDGEKKTATPPAAQQAQAAKALPASPLP